MVIPAVFDFQTIEFTARRIDGEPSRSGEGVVIADLNFALIDEWKRLRDS